MSIRCCESCGRDTANETYCNHCVGRNRQTFRSKEAMDRKARYSWMLMHDPNHDVDDDFDIDDSEPSVPYGFHVI